MNLKSLLRNPAISAAVAAVVLIVAGPGYWFYTESLKEDQRKAVAQRVSDTTRAIGLALSMRGAEGEAKQLDALVAEAEERLSDLRAIQKRHEPRILESAELYVADTQRLLRRQAALVRVRAVAAASQNALMSHMARAENRSDEWIREAVALRKKLEQDFFAYRTAAAAYASALDAMPATRRQASETVLGAQFYDETALGRVQTRAARDAREATEELEALRKLPPPR